MVRASLTKLTELEVKTDSSTLLESATSLAEKSKSLQQDYRNHQLAIIDRTEDDEALDQEQQALFDDGDDSISALSVRLQCLISLATPFPIKVAAKQITARKLQDISDCPSH